MSARVVKFILKREASLDKNLKQVEEERIGLYACCNSIASWVANIKDVDEARKLIKPENIDSLFITTMSFDELEVFNAILLNHPEYYFFDEVFVYKIPKKQDKQATYLDDCTYDDEQYEYTDEDRECDADNERLIRFCSGEENDEI